MRQFEKRIKFITISILLFFALSYFFISFLQLGDKKIILKAKEVDVYINQYCKTHGLLPTKSHLTQKFSELTTRDGWYFFTDDKTWLKFQYPVRWKNSEAIGLPKTSEFTATVYAYSVEYFCNVAKKDFKN